MLTPALTIAQYSRSFTITPSSDQIARGPETLKHKVLYSEYQSFGEPPYGLGAIGDVYLDLSKGNHSLYAKVEDGWRRWPGPGQRHTSLRHPTYASHILWCQVDTALFGWVTQKAAKRKVLMSSASQIIGSILSLRRNSHRKALKKNSDSVGNHPNKRDSATAFSATGNVATDAPFSVPPTMNAVPTLIDRFCIPDPPQHVIESKTQTQTTETVATRRKTSHPSTSPTRIVQAPANWDDLNDISQYLMTMVNGANGSCVTPPTLVTSQTQEGRPLPAVINDSPGRDVSFPERGTKRKGGPDPDPEPDPVPAKTEQIIEQSSTNANPVTATKLEGIFTPSPSPKLDSNEDRVTGPDIEHIFTPSPSPKPHSNEDPVAGPDLAHLFTPPPPPGPDNNKDREARSSSQCAAYLLFTPSPSPKPAPTLPGPDLDHIFTPSASPPPPEPEPDLAHDSACSAPTSKPAVSRTKPSPASSSTLSGTGSRDGWDSAPSHRSASSKGKAVPLSTPKSGTKRDNRPDSRSAPRSSPEPVKMHKMKTPKTPRTPEKRKDSSARSASTKVPSVKKPVISHPNDSDDEVSWRMDLDDDDAGGSGRRSTGSRAFSPDGNEEEDDDELPNFASSQKASASTSKVSAPRTPSSSGRKRLSQPVSAANSKKRRLSENGKTRVKRKSQDMVHASGSRSSKVSSTSTPSRAGGPLTVENDVIDLTGLLSSDSESDDGKARVKDKGKIKAKSNEEARVKEEKDGNSASTRVKLEPNGKRRVPAVTISPTKLKLKERKWKTYDPPSMSFEPQAESSTRGQGKLKVMPRMKDRPPSAISKRTATIDREQKARRLSEVIDLTMELSEEDEDEGERERKKIRPLEVCRARMDKEVERVQVKQEPGSRNDCRDEDDKAEMGGDEMVGEAGEDDHRDHQAETAPEDPLSANVMEGAEGPEEEVEDEMAGEAGEDDHRDHQTETALEDTLSANAMAGGEMEESPVVGAEGPEAEAEAEDDEMLEDPPQEPVCEPLPASPPRLASPQPMLTEDLPMVDESVHQTDSETETLDGDVEMGDTTMGDTTMVGQPEDDDAKTVDDDEKTMDEEDEEIDELDDENDQVEDERWSDLHLELIFGSEAVPGMRHCRFCLGQKGELYVFQIMESPDRWLFIRRNAIKHCLSSHESESEAFLGLGESSLQEMAKRLNTRLIIQSSV